MFRIFLFKNFLFLSFASILVIFTILSLLKEKPFDSFLRRNRDNLYLLLVLFFVVSLFLGLLSVFTGSRVGLFLVTTPLFGAFVVVNLARENPPFKLLVLMTLTIGSLIMLSSFSISGFHPIGADSPRFAAWADRIILDGRWVPGRYMGNQYYDALFNAVPGSWAIISLVTGIEILGGVAAPWAVFLLLTFGLGTYVLISRLFESKRGGIFGAIFVISIPPLSVLPGIPQTVGYVLYAIFGAILALNLTMGGRRSLVPLIIIVAFTGIVFHATFFVWVFVILISVYLFRNIQDWKMPKLRGLILLVVVLSLAYWIHLALLDVPVGVGKRVMTSFVNLLTGQEFLAPSPHQYLQAEVPFYLSLAWSAVPALIGSLFIYELLGKLKGWIKSFSLSFFLAVGGSLLLLFVFLGISPLPLEIPSRYLYGGFAVGIIPASVYLARLVKGKDKITITITAVFLTLVMFSGIHAPAFSSDVNPRVRKGIGRSPADWKVAETLINRFPPDYQLEPLGVPKVAGALCYYTRVLTMRDYTRYFLWRYRGNPEGHIYLFNATVRENSLPARRSLVYSGYKYRVAISESFVR